MRVFSSRVPVTLRHGSVFDDREDQDAVLTHGGYGTEEPGEPAASCSPTPGVEAFGGFAAGEAASQ
ncbi:MAG: hypothetical protein GY720_08910 [bacterium]|nr:hypothetical protein [bacterium]